MPNLTIQQWAVKQKKTDDDVIRKLRIAFVSHVALATPVDTGQARANWQSGETVNYTPLPDTDVTGMSAINEAVKQASAVSTDKTFLIFNNLPYIERLENGYSGQAPQGMVKITLTLFEQVLKQKNGLKQLIGEYE